MGMAKNQQIEEWEQGWSFSEGYVCANCVDDYALKAVLQASEEIDEVCNFCGSSPAAELDVLVAAFVAGLRTEYGDADDEGVAYDSREGGYQATTIDTWDLVSDFSHVFCDNEELLDAVRGAVEDRQWVDLYYAYDSPDEALSAAWENFCNEVQFKTRYVFWLRDDIREETWGGEVPAGVILDRIGDLIQKLGLLRELPAGHRFWRALPHEDREVDWGASRLGTVPQKLASQANRMSPAGIPMFYGAEDAETAVQEAIVRTTAKWATSGSFALSEACTVVDLTKLPDIPSMFDAERSSLRRPIMFLRDFVATLRKPARETFEQVDYVPTQIVTEYLLRIFGHGVLVSGLLYDSALTQQPCVVIDIPNDRCVEQSPGWEQQEGLTFGLIPNSMQTWKISKVASPL